MTLKSVESRLPSCKLDCADVDQTQGAKISERFSFGGRPDIVCSWLHMYVVCLHSEKQTRNISAILHQLCIETSVSNNMLTLQPQ
eukprot:44563-Eustigmatos_ZCMA.PRE.1